MKILPTFALLFVAGCTAGCTASGDLSPAAQTAMTIACQRDAALQPILVPVVAGVVPQASGVAAADNLLVHPAVVAACAQLGAVPVAATVAKAP